MKKSYRDDISHLAEDQHEPGSGGLVLKNNLGITTPTAMDIREKEEK